MDGVSLTALALELMASIHALSGYPRVQAVPEIHRIEVVELHRRFCQGPCRVQAYYRADEGIFIDAQLEIARDDYARSILLHELVHHVQRIEGRFSRMPSDCDRWYAAELEAYEIQNRYLEAINSPRRVYMNPWRTVCGN